MRFHFLPGFCVGGRGVSPCSIVTWRGFGTCPSLGPTSLYSPGRFGFSPGFCVAIVRLSWSGSATSLAVSGLPGLGLSSAAAVLRRDGQPHSLVPIPRALSQLLGTFRLRPPRVLGGGRTKITAM